MAQMTHKSLARALCALLASSGTVWAAEPPANAIAAEMRQDWAAAAQIYHDTLLTHPDDVALWLRLADVEAKRGNASAAADAVGRAAALRPTDAALQAKYSQALATAQRPREALQAIQRALAIRPNDVDDLIAQAKLANWTGDPALAEQSLAKVRELAPQRDDVLGDMARSAAWRGDLDDGITLMRRYLQTHPDDRAAWLDLSRFYAWQGNYPHAEDLNANYRSRFGADDLEREWDARVLAWGGRRHEALALNTPLLATTPNDYGRNYTQAIAWRQSYIPDKALPYVDTVRQLKPNTKDTADLVSSTPPTVLPQLQLPFWRSSDSDHITILHAGADIDWPLGPRTTLLLDAGWNRYSAPANGPFAALGGSGSINQTYGMIGVRQALNDDYALVGLIGASSVNHGGGSTGIGSFSLLARPSDNWQWQAGVERQLIGVSPLAASLGITRDGGVVEVHWTPDLRWTLDLTARHDHYSDSNQRDEFAFALRRATVRDGIFSLDLGVAGQWFGFDHDLARDGYYSPSDYRRVAFTAGTYLHFNDDVSLGIQGALGLQKDETMPSWKSANDLNSDLAVRIFHDWQLHLRAGYTQRRQASGGYDGRFVGLTLQGSF